MRRAMWAALALALAASGGATVAAFEGENAYGPGLHRDRYGRPFEYRTDDGRAVPGFVPVQPNGYGLGVGMDQYGRPVRAIDPTTGQTLPAGSIDTDDE